MAYIGNTGTTQTFTPSIDYFSGNGSTTAFTLSRPVASVAQVQVTINNVAQNPSSAYTVSGSTITFTSAPLSGSNNIYVYYTSPNTQIIAPSQGTVGTSQLTSDLQNANYGFKNRIINGAMVIDQRNAGASVAFTSSAYTLDRWVGAVGTATGTTIQRSTTSTTGFSNSALITIGTGASPAAGAVNRIYQVIEGFNIADLAWGTASAATVTLSFWVRSSVTGTFSGALYGASTIQSYPFNYTISAANTFEQKTVTIAGPTTGTWDSTNGTGIYVNFDLGSGTTFKGTANAWATGTFIGVTGATNLCATTGATFYITGVQLEKGSTATSFDYRPYGTELALCQRYYYVIAGFYIEGYANAASIRAVTIPVNFPVTMRATPTRTVITAGSYTNIRGSSSTYAGLLTPTATFASASIESAAAGTTTCSNQTESMSAEL